MGPGLQKRLEEGGPDWRDHLSKHDECSPCLNLKASNPDPFETLGLPELDMHPVAAGVPELHLPLSLPLV